MRRRVTRVPNTAQGKLAFAQAAGGEPQGSVGCKSAGGGTKFVEAAPWHLFLGAERVDSYLKAHGLGWVVRLREELQKTDFSDLEVNYQGTGRRPYHPRMMLGLMVYAVLKRKWTLREVEELAVVDVGAWWICGGLQPDHSTIGDFMLRHQKQITREFFDTLVRDLVGRKGIKNATVAIDGTVIEAAASRFDLLSREAAEQAAGKARDACGQQPEADPKLMRQAEHAEEVAHVAREREEKQASKGRKTQGGVVTPTEPDAVLQPCKDGRRRPSYKPSVLVHECGLIVAQTLEPSSETAAVPELFEQYQHAFGADPIRALFDAGYHTIDVLAEMGARNIDALCPSGNVQNGDWKRKGSNGKYAKVEFTYDAESDRYRCPAGEWLEPGKPYRDTSSGQEVRKFRTKRCKGCELRAQCTQGKDGRVIVRFKGEELKEMMEEVLSQPRARRQYRLRAQIVERVFAEIGWRQGLRRFHRRGRAGSALEFGLHCIAYNLKWALERGAFSRFGAAMAHLVDMWRVVAIRARLMRISVPWVLMTGSMRLSAAA